MQAMTWTAEGYRFDGEPAPFITGEFPYFRVPRQDWEERLRRLKEGGANGVATYIPWNIHEPEEGVFRFDDCPGRELTDFLTTCRDMGLLVVARPGPYVYSELTYAGLPTWLVRGYPEILARDARGGMIGSGVVSYLHPVFLDKARRYYRAVTAVLRPFLAGNGGPICMVQLDNELSGLQVWSGSIDYHPETMGFGRAEGRYPRWLAAHYPSIDALNQAYGRSYADFAAVRPIDEGEEDGAYHGGPPATVCEARRSRDYADFYHETMAEYLCLLGSWLREDDIDVPVCHNAPNMEMVPDFRECVERLGPDFLLGADLYYTLGPSWHQNNPTPQYALKVLLTADYLKELGQPPTVFELQGGNLADFPPMLAEDAEACYMTNTALGMKGMNYYIFTGGPNFGDTGTTGAVYDYHAMIGADNQVRPTYHAMAAHNAAAREHAWLQTAHRAANVTIGFAWEDQRWDEERCGCYSAPGGLFGAKDCRTFLKDGVLFALMGSGFLPELCEIGNGLPSDRIAIIPCAQAMAADKQQQIVTFLQEGGRAILAPVVPTMDERYNPCTLLADALGLGTVTRTESAHHKLRLADGSLFHEIARQYTATCHAGTAIAFNSETGEPAAWEIPVGRGTAIWLGAHWSFQSFEQQRLLVTLCRRLGGQELLRSSNPTVWASLWRQGERACLFVLNLFSGAQETELAVWMDDDWRELGRIRLPAMTVKVLDL